MKISRRCAFITAIALISSSFLLCGCDKDSKDDSSKNNIIYYNTSGEDVSEDSEQDKQDGKETEKSENKNDESNADTELQIAECNINEPSDLNGVSVNLTEVKYLSKKKTDDETKLVYCMFEIKNVTESAIAVSPLDNFVVSADGQEPSMDFTASIRASVEATKKFDVEQRLDGVISSGNTVKGYLALEIPDNASKIEIEYHPHKCVDGMADDIVFKYTVNVSDIK